MGKEDLEKIASAVVDAALEVHRNMGPGLLESAYEMALCHELSLRGIPFERQKAMNVQYKGVALDCGFRIDVVAGGDVFLELKSCEQLAPIHEAQLLNYLKLGDKRIGLLINFNVRLLKNGLKRIVNNLEEEPVGNVTSI
ncbi:MAG: GxxExxY protein [Chthoniobacteraceae bacterium]